MLKQMTSAADCLMDRTLVEVLLCLHDGRWILGGGEDDLGGGEDEFRDIKILDDHYLVLDDVQCKVFDTTYQDGYVVFDVVPCRYLG